MTQRVIVERRFDAPTATETMLSEAEAVADAQQGVALLHSFVARDGERVVSLYDAPDAATVLARYRDAGLVVEHLYAAHNIVDFVPSPSPGHTLTVCQRDVGGIQGLTPDAVRAMAADNDGCNRRLRLTHFGGYLDHGLQRMVCVYFGPDAESVRRSNMESGTPFERIWPGQMIAPTQA